MQITTTKENEMLATPRDACREYAANVGMDRPNAAYILTDYDTWEPNPYYCGPKMPHPEEGVDKFE